MEVVRQDKRTLVHLVDYSNGTATGPITVRVSSSLGRVAKARLVSPRHDELDLKVERDPLGARITVPAVDVYAVAVLELE
jgi:hypothetical protein